MSNDTQPEIRFPGFTEDWEQRKLADSIKVLDGDRGSNYPHDSDFFKNGDTLFLDTGNVTKNGFKFDNVKYISKEKDEQLRAGKLEKKDFVLTTRGTLGNVGFYDELIYKYHPKIRINSAMLILRKTDEKLSYNYLHTLLKGKLVSDFMRKNQVGSAQPHITKTEFLKLDMNVPRDIKEQQKIGTFFKQLDDTIALHQRKLDLLKETKKGFLQKMFPKNGAKVPEVRFPGFTGDWEDREFSEIVKTTGYKAYLSEAFEVGEYPVIQQGDKPILGYSDKKPFENFEDVVLFGDHTLSLYKPETPFLVATDGLKIITVPNFSGSFLLSLLEKYVPESQGYKRHFTILKKEQVAFPTDVKERVLIGEFFTQIDRTITLHERELDLLKETKKGFLQKMLV